MMRLMLAPWVEVSWNGRVKNGRDCPAARA